MSSDSTCPFCDELEKELDLCHEALNRRGVDLGLVAALGALERAATVYGNGDPKDDFHRVALEEAAINYARTRREHEREGATDGAQEGPT